MHEFAGMRTMDVWYAHLSEDEVRGGRHSEPLQGKAEAKGSRTG